MNEESFPNRDFLYADYKKFLPARTLAVRDLETRIGDKLECLSSRPRVSGRVKTFESYFKKYIRHTRAKSRRVGDLIGVRVVCPFLEDLAAVEDLIKKHFNVVEVDRKGGDHTYREFGYESIHLMITLPEDIVEKFGFSEKETAEIQIRTILQDAWAEVEHELIYKVEFTPFDDPLKRKLAAVNASLSLADIIFQEIRSYQQELHGELGKRRFSFFRKIEESADAFLFTETPGQVTPVMDLPVTGPAKEDDEEPLPYEAPSNVSIDELLLDALSAHNNNNFPKAIAIYSHILEMNPNTMIRSIIYQHRGMAFYTRSHYEDAIADFTETLKLDPKSYKSAYYKGIVYSVLGRYSDAVESYDKSLEINPYQPYCLFRRGQAYFHLEDFPQALGDCEAALALESLEAARKFKELVLSKLKM